MRWPVYLVAGMLIAATLIFVVEFVVSTRDEINKPKAPKELTAETYMDRVNAVLAGANSENGAQLVERYQCVNCHRVGANKIAPSFEGIAERAGTRHPPLTAAAYIYESITNPTAYVVKGYTPAMPQNYPERLSDRELGDIIAYLLTTDAH